MNRGGLGVHSFAPTGMGGGGEKDNEMAQSGVGCAEMDMSWFCEFKVLLKNIH